MSGTVRSVENSKTMKGLSSGTLRCVYKSTNKPFGGCTLYIEVCPCERRSEGGEGHDNTKPCTTKPSEL